MQLANNSVAIEQHPRFQQRRQRQFGSLPVDFVDLALRQFIDPYDLDGEIVRAVAVERFGDDQPGGLVEVFAVAVDGIGDESRTGMFINAVGCQNEYVALFDVNGLVVDFDLRVHP